MIYFLKNILSIDECNSMVDEFHKLKKIKLNTDITDDGLNPKTSFGYRGYGIFDNFLEKLKPIIIEYNNGKKIRNVNSYVREYKNESYLKKHVDREDIGITLSICIYSDINTEWPLQAEYNGIQISKNLQIGDGLLIIGSNKIEHWRDVLKCGENESVIQLFLHWITEVEKKSII